MTGENPQTKNRSLEAINAVQNIPRYALELLILPFVSTTSLRRGMEGYHREANDSNPEQIGVVLGVVVGASGAGFLGYQAVQLMDKIDYNIGWEALAVPVVTNLLSYGYERLRVKRINGS